jgi:sporulation protein YlmC with PRC-barrel domain
LLSFLKPSLSLARMQVLGPSSPRHLVGKRTCGCLVVIAAATSAIVPTVGVRAQQSVSSSVIGVHVLKAKALIGAKVTNALEEHIGDVDDIVIDRTGVVTGLAVNLEGGKRRVLMAFTPLQFRHQNGIVTVFANISKSSALGLPRYETD